MNAKELRELAANQFGKRLNLMNLWQDIADNFYVERADFTISNEIGDHVADNLTTSYPLLVRRDLGNQFGSMLRPSGQKWFKNGLRDDEQKLDNDSLRWLEMVTTTQRKAMYDPVTQFTRATKEGDHDFAAFGQAVISVRLNRDANALLYQSWHLRDVAWQENDEGQIGNIFRRWKPTVRDLRRKFPKTAHATTEQQMRKNPFDTVDCWHFVVEADMYDSQQTGRPYWSIYYDETHDTVLEELAVWDQIYVIPRWQTVSGSQYAYSPATIAALPDARLLQAMTATLLEAGEKATTPPMIAVREAIRSDIALYAGGITIVDAEYDERLGEVLRPLTQDKSGIPLGVDMQRDCRALLASAFYLDKLRPFLPTADKEMTAFQAGQIVAQYIRDALPLFEPMEMEYNGRLCDRTFDVLMRGGAFGSPFDMPARLQGQQTQFRFESPLHEAIEAQKGQQFLQAKALLAEAVAIDPTAIAMLDAKQALRDALQSTVSTTWVRSEQDVSDYEAQARAEQEQQKRLMLMQQGANVAATAATARKDFAAAGPVSAPPQ